jgi:ABC-type multidrug transport system fused ATPase/permease subunit
VVLDRGRMLEEGTAEDLMARRGVFAELFRERPRS